MNEVQLNQRVTLKLFISNNKNDIFEKIINLKTSDVRLKIRN
jgi:hypothetical protein